MRRTLFLLPLLLGIASSGALAGPAPKVEVCHIPPDNPANFHTIRVSENALSAHLAHGDLGGPCNAVCDDLCDDGNACTIDHNDDCEQNGCLAIPAPVDCSDGDLCTVDSCEPASGCVNTPIACIAPDLCTVSACAPDTGECVDSPVICDEGFTCDLATGLCEPDVECLSDADCDPGYTCIQGECIEGAARNLRGPDTNLDCSGPEVGYTNVLVLEDGVSLKVEVEFTNGAPNDTATVYWVCTNVPGGCHGDACGAVNLGTITTDSSGQGFFSIILPDGNPYPGKYVHFDVGPDEWYTSITHLEIFPSAPATLESFSAESAVTPADPATAPQ